MRLHYLFICVIFGIACKKTTSDQIISRSSFPAEFSIPVTKQEATAIHTLFAQGKIKNPSDFLVKVDSIKSATTGSEVGKIEATALMPMGGSYSPSQDENDMAVNLPDYPNTLGSEDYITHTRTITTRFQENLTFPIRRNSIQVVVPFQYDWGIDPNYGTNTITNLRTSTPIQLLPAGNFWGAVTQGTTQGINSGMGSNPYGQSAAISAFASAEETRTAVYSTTGNIKISTNLNLGAFQAGAEFGAGFTISSAAYTYNQYSMNADGEIWIEGSTYGYNMPPNTQFQGTCMVLDYGILQNQ